MNIFPRSSGLFYYMHLLAPSISIYNVTLSPISGLYPSSTLARIINESVCSIYTNFLSGYRMFTVIMFFDHVTVM